MSTYPNRRLPYFNALLNLLDEHPALAQSFGKHVHWGYWAHPPVETPNVEAFALAAERLSEEVANAARCDSAPRILDAGCGFGGTLAHLNGKRQGLELVGLNLDERQLARAARQTTPAEGNRLAWVNADACALPFADESFDAVLAVECIFHFPSRQAFFQEARRVLRPGGHLALSDFIATAPLRPTLWLGRRIVKRIGFFGDCDLNFSFGDYRRLAAETGFEPTTERDITGATLPTYDFLHELRKQVDFRNPAAAAETLFAEYASRLRLLRYGILGFRKPVISRKIA